MNHTLTYDHYYLYDEITSFMEEMQQKYPDYVTVLTIGTSSEGRDIKLMEISSPSDVDKDEKPGVYVEGNMHAGEVTGSMTVLYLMDTILSNLQDPKIQKLLEKSTYYLLPRVSPDGAEYYLVTPYMVRSLNQPYPFETQQKGLVQEDLDGDGTIRFMRVKDPNGIYKISEEDPRLFVKRKPDDVDGPFYNVYQEGYISEYDQLTINNAPSLYGRDFNRNYPAGWQAEKTQHGAGEMPLSVDETKANANFLIEHKNICFIVDMHTSGGQIIYTPSYKAAKKAEKYDVELEKELGKMAVEETGYVLINGHDDYLSPNEPECFGGFDDFGHFLIGVPTYTVECWDLDRRAGVPENYPPKDEITEEERVDSEKKIMAWIDENVPNEFKPWTSFNHPQLGEVEIGGPSYKYIFQNPPVSFLEQDIEKHTRFLLRAGMTLPDVQVEKTKIESIGEDLYKIEVTISNSGYLSTYVFKEALNNKRIQPIRVTLEGDYELLSGEASQQIGQLEGRASQKVNGWSVPSTTMQQEGMKKKLTWIVRSKADCLTLKVKGDRFKPVNQKISLQ